MKLVEHHINLSEENLILNNQRAMFWPAQDTLIISDVHIGKTAHFRKHGIPIPNHVQNKDLERLSLLIDNYEAKSLIVVGDLFHAGGNSDVEQFTNWRETYPDLDIRLVKGNHDRVPKRICDNYNIEVINPKLEIDPFCFVHDPNDRSEGFSICGHIHPGFQLQVKGQPRIKLPSFQLSEDQLLLPAFSEFTGLTIAKNQKDFKYFAFSNDSFFEFN